MELRGLGGGEPTTNRTPLLPVAPVIATHRERAGRVKGAQRRSGPLTRLSAPGQSGTGATANQEAIAPGKLGATLAGTGAEAKQFWLFLPEGKLALTSVRILKQHPGAHKTRAPADPTLTYGRERPRRTAPGPHLRCGGGVAHAPSLLRHLCWGAYRAAQTAARPGSARPASTSAPSMDCGASVSAVPLECIPVGKWPPLRDGGPTAP